MEKKTKTILGLDLGVTSIGWAVVKSENDMPNEILGMGVRIIPLSTDENDEFTKGNAISKNRERTLKRSQRRLLDRYQMRRETLINYLKNNNMMPDEKMLLHLTPLEIWGLRAKAARQQVSLQELGRVLLHLNQKRGYKHSKSDNGEDEKKQTDYVTAVNNRYDYIKSKSITIGELFYKGLKDFDNLKKEWDEIANEPVFKTKEKVFPRIAYEEEFCLIMQAQKQSDTVCEKLFEIIYHQRPLKSQKGLVNLCEFEKKPYTTKEGKLVEAGPKVTPKSSPLFQVCKLWESINNITIKNRKGEEFLISIEQKQKLFDFLDGADKLNQTELFAVLGIPKNAGYFSNDQIKKAGLKGNTTKSQLIAIIGKKQPSLTFNLTIEKIADKNTGELLMQISKDFEKEPLYRLWHIIYSLNNHEEDCIKKLESEFGFNEEIAKELASLDFTKSGFGNKSAKAIRKILPYLQEGLKYSEACEKAGYNHSNSLTKEENISRELNEKLCLLRKNSLRQPVVEKILNQMINLVNGIIQSPDFGNPDEIRVELARELTQSKEERNNAYSNINKREKKNEKIKKYLAEHPEFKKKGVSKRDIDRYRLWEEFGKVSPYEPTKVIGLGELFSGIYDIEHIVPKALRFDDSFANKTICSRKFNSGENGKNNFTAFDYMSAKRSKDEFEAYLKFIEAAYKDRKISKTKYENLLVSAENLKDGFIERQLRESQYIARKAKFILSEICHNVHATSGTITSRLRELWGWNEVLEDLNLPKYKELGLIEVIEINHHGQISYKDKIKDWSKRDDHRHHAIDALTIACTRQGFIQRLNTLNAQHTRDEMYSVIEEHKKQYGEKLSLLDKYLLKFKPFDTNKIINKASGILISFKPGKKVASYSRRLAKKSGKKEVVQRKIIEPRGPLSEQSVYGKIKVQEIDNNGEINVREEYVIKYPVSTITPKDLGFIVDGGIRNAIEARLNEYNNNPKEAYKDLANNPIWLNKEKRIPIKTVRCFTGIKQGSIAPIKVKDLSWGIEYEKYVKTANNHHIAIYSNENGKRVEHQVTFWHAAERKRYGMSQVVIKDPAKAWDEVINRELPQKFLEQLPGDKWVYETSLQQNEPFVFNMTEEDLKDAIDNKKHDLIAPNVFRVRKLTSGAYWFNQQYETTPRENLDDKKAGRCIQASLSSMKGIKVKINTLGEIFLA